MAGASGQDQVAIIKKSLQHVLPDVKVFRDVDDLKSTSNIEEYVSSSSAVLVFLSRGYFLSVPCMRELRCALSPHNQCPLVIVHETDSRHGGSSLEEHQAQCPDELWGELFDGTVQIIPWVCANSQQEW